MWARKSALIQPRTSLARRAAPHDAARARARSSARASTSHLPGSKDTIEIMNWTNEIWHKFRNFSALFRIFRALLMRISWHFIIFWELYPWNSDKIPSKFRRKTTKFIDQSRNEMKFHFISFRPKSLTVFCWNFEVLAVRRQRNLVELEKY